MREVGINPEDSLNPNPSAAQILDRLKKKTDNLIGGDQSTGIKLPKIRKSVTQSVPSSIQIK